MLVETVAFAISVVVVTCVVQDGKSNYLEGAMVCLRDTTCNAGANW